MQRRPGCRIMPRFSRRLPGTPACIADAPNGDKPPFFQMVMPQAQLLAWLYKVQVRRNICERLYSAAHTDFCK